MGVFDDVSRFFEDRLDEFLKNNPHLEIQALIEQLREQEADTNQLLAGLERKQQRQEAEILSLAQEVKAWHERIAKAQAAGRVDLAQAAQEREAALLHQGNQVWGQMEATRNRLQQAQALRAEIQERLKVAHQRAQQVQREQQQAKTVRQNESSPDTKGWQSASRSRINRNQSDPLEETFRQWELDEELAGLKQKMGRH